uniref:Uncharacterized protein n=1 Tax=Sinocyclocheilus rhinocerous TaxID=307959 RepID=A0A673LC78_9TELE
MIVWFTKTVTLIPSMGHHTWPHVTSLNSRSVRPQFPKWQFTVYFFIIYF